MTALSTLKDVALPLSVETDANGETVLKVTTAAGGLVSAKRAVSCLIEPQTGDIVHVSEIGEDLYILNVLERPTPEQVSYAVTVPGKLQIRADEVSVSARTIDVVSETLNLAGRFFYSLFKVSQRWAGRDMQQAHLVSSHALDRVSMTDNADIQRAGTLKQDVDGALSVGSQVAAITSKGDMRINGERIHMG